MSSGELAPEDVQSKVQAWLDDKPWIVFTAAGMGSAACVTQTIASNLGSAVLWTEAGSRTLHKMTLFATPSRAGFNGRQAFSKGNDPFFNSMKSITALSKLLVDSYDDEERARGILPKCAAIAFPLIVVDGRLFEAYFDSTTNSTKLEESKWIRCHWRGAPVWTFHATIDVVASDYLDKFVATRTREANRLLRVLESTRESIAACFATGSIDKLEITKGSRGVIGLHFLLGELLDEEKKIQGIEGGKGG